MAHRPTKAQQQWRPGQIKPRSSVKRMFSSMVLGLEALVLMFFSLALFGLHRNEDSGMILLIGGLAAALLAIVAAGLLRKPIGYWMGWALQIIIVAGGFLDYLMFFVGGAFALCWWYAVTKGTQLDAENAERDRLEAEYDAAQAAKEERNADG